MDPARLLRKTWTDPDELARELYVMFRDQAGESMPTPSAPAERAPIVPGRTPVAQPFSEEAALVRQRPVPRAVVAQQANALPVVPPLPVLPRLRAAADAGAQAMAGPAPPLPVSAPATVPSILSQRAAATIAVNAGPGIERRGQAVGQRPDVRATAFSLEAGAAFLPGEPVRPMAQPTAGVPVIPPVPRTPIATAAPPDIVTTASSSPTGAGTVPGRGVLVASEPGATGPQLEDVPLPPPPPFELESEPPPLATDPALAAKRDQASTDDPLTRLYWGYAELQIGYVTAAGIPGGTVTSSNVAPTPTIQPGKGQMTLYDYDDGGKGLLQRTGDLLTVLNYSLLPISGGQLWLFRIMLDQLWALPPMFCHAIVQTAITPCIGTTPGAGKVTTWYRKSGVLASDQVLPVENWYNVTAAVGKHCTVGWLDATSSLEVLDC